MRLQATSRDDKPVFVGVARTADADRYLEGTRHTDITDVDYDPFDPSYRDFDGKAPARPVEQDIWAASTHGEGTQTLDWKAREGDWTVVVMNEDGSAGVDTGVRAGAKLGFLDAARLRPPRRRAARARAPAAPSSAAACGRRR